MTRPREGSGTIAPVNDPLPTTQSWAGPAPTVRPVPGGGAGLSGLGGYAGAWLLLLRVPGVALALPRLGLGVLLVVLVLVADRLWAALMAQGEGFGGAAGADAGGPLFAVVVGVAEAVGRVVPAVLSLEVRAAARALFRGIVEVPGEVAWVGGGGGWSGGGGGGGGVRWWGLGGLVIVGGLAALLAGVLGGAIARSAACELGPRRPVGMRVALGFARARWRALLLAVAGPWLAVWGVGLVLGLIGQVFFGLWGGALGGVGAVLLPVWMVLSAGYALLVLAVFLGHVLPVGAVACDDADGFDALQRTGAFVVNRPLRLVAQLLVLLGAVALGGAVLSLLLAITGTVVARVIGYAGPGASAGGPVVGELTGFGAGLLLMVLLGYIFSAYFSASAALYLTLRQSLDGEDPAEVWMPVPAGLPAQAGLAAAASSAGGPWRFVPGPEVTEQATRLAGALAEAGVTGLTLRHADGSVEDLAARVTDLPGVLVRMRPGDELRGSAGLRVRLEPGGGGLAWWAEGELGRALSRGL
jgi:hypothetical protein